MCLAYAVRPATRGVDAFFAPAKQVREAAARVAGYYPLERFPQKALYALEEMLHGR